MCCKLRTFVLLLRAMADVEPESWVFTTLQAQDSVIPTQEFSRYLSSSTCHFSIDPFVPASTNLQIYMFGGAGCLWKYSVPLKKLMLHPNFVLFIIQPPLFFLSLKQEGPLEHLVYHVVEGREPVWGFR